MIRKISVGLIEYQYSCYHDHVRVSNITQREIVTAITIPSLGAFDEAATCISFCSGSFSNVRCDTLILPEGCTRIGYNTFSGSLIKEVVLPESLIAIETNAFANSCIERITIPANVVDVANSAFDNTPLFSQKENWEDGILYVDNWAIVCDPTDGTISFRDGTVAIASWFCPQPRHKPHCKLLQFPDTVKSIGDFAFFNLSVDEVKLPKDLKSLGRGAFQSSAIQILEVGELEKIPAYAFYACHNLQHITLGSVKHIGEWAFSCCNNLEAVALPHVETIAISAFEGCQKLQNVSLSDSLKKVKNRGFDCSNILTAELPKASYAPNSFKGLKHVTVNSLISEKLLWNIETLNIQSAKTIKADYGTMLQNLKSLTLGKSVSTVKEGAFSMCPKLETVTLNEETYVDPTAFYGSDVKFVYNKKGEG